ncbi:hypothetical protein DR950_17960 [Kitasatospora xanthocidica]|uniref:Cysteine dioxygenase n=1 Tax=Kitasatospora xanthocidica TaxID=83382 RepID=A0A372ZVU0_9ACTN|nr:hypothetical protein [Kitasatospora xanthocidica]RGD59427.1 hypothetical protein DR950_17960 [Kitasatospora xanthocidica]
MTPALLPSLRGLDWDDLPAVASASALAFHDLTRDNWALLADLLTTLPDSPALAAMCERFDFLDKLVLHQDDDYRLRVHRFRPGYFDRPHDHRWSFASMILTGAYRHVQYGTNEGFDTIDPAALRPRQIRTERAGDQYVLHHTAVHSVTADAGTISLVLRGPAVKDAFRIIDAPSGGSFTARGTQSETDAQRDAKRMSPDVIATTVHDILTARPTQPKETR